MKTKYQTFAVAAVSAAIVIFLGGVIMAGLYLLAPAAEAKTEALSAAVPETQTAPGSSRTITVVGEGRVLARPDLAQATVGVEVVGNDVKQATSDAAQTMENLLKTLTDLGIAEKDIQTAYYNVWVERPYAPQGGPTGETVYHVNNNVNITIRDLDNVATILGQAIEAGANSIASVNFNVADPSSLRSEARQKAVENALAEAEELAKLNGVEIGEVVGVSEVISGGAYYVSELAAESAGLGGGAGPISPGEVGVSVQLEVTYAIK